MADQWWVIRGGGYMNTVEGVKTSKAAAEELRDRVIAEMGDQRVIILLNDERIPDDMRAMVIRHSNEALVDLGEV